MSFKRSILYLSGALSLAVVALAVFELLPQSYVIGSNKEVKVLSLLTGLEGTDGPVLAVKIDDTSSAHPQVGIASADVVYIEQVEGGLTRLAAIFSSKIPPLVGPVRSARISDIELLSQYGKVGFVYSGAQRLMYPIISAANLFDLGANRLGPTIYFNEPDRSPPYAMMASLPELFQVIKERNYSVAPAKNMGWSFSDVQEGLIPIMSSEVSWPAAKYSVSWSQTEKRWLITHNGRPNLDSTGFQLGAGTFLIQKVSITNSIYKDKVGGVTPFSATVGSGECYLLRDGGYLPCNWSRPAEESVTTFTDKQGRPITFAPGQVWFALTDREPVFAYPPAQDASQSTTK